MIVMFLLMMRNFIVLKFSKSVDDVSVYQRITTS